MLDFYRKHPLLLCLIIALILRLFAVVYSKGFMAHDDHFETVRIAYDGIQQGLLNDDNLMIWDTNVPENIGRSPLYVLFLYSLMKIQEFMGIHSLDSMMPLIRLIHALLSLLFVWYGFKYVSYATGDRRYSFLAGIILAAHFLMPYLSVRNLIELVSADLFMPAVFLAYKGVRENSGRILLISGILSGLAWMVRFSVCLAVFPIPFVIWYLRRDIRPALYYGFGILLMLLFSASLDIPFLGGFGQSTINILHSYFVGEPTLAQPFWMYIPLVFGIFIPPFSFYFLMTGFRKKVISDHLILISIILFFFISHSLIANKQERFMIPIFPLIVVMGVVGLSGWISSGNISRLNKKLFKYSAIFALGINLILLPIFTFNYAHKGMVEPYVFLSGQDDVDTVLIDRTERHRYIALGYAGYKSPEIFILDKWTMLSAAKEVSGLFGKINYFIVYSDTDPDRHVDSLSRVFGPLVQVYHSPPSTIDVVLHFLNPRHNHTNEAWVYKKADKAKTLSEDS